jgi:hypothetical protein
MEAGQLEAAGERERIAQGSIADKNATELRVYVQCLVALVALDRFLLSFCLLAELSEERRFARKKAWIDEKIEVGSSTEICALFAQY